MNVTTLTLIRAGMAADKSATAHESAIGFIHARDIARGYKPFICGFSVEHAQAACADRYDAEHLFREADALRAEERAA